MTQSIHNTLVASVVADLEENNFSKIKADIPGYDQPDDIWWTKDKNNKFTPDATAQKDGEKYIVEAETKDSLGTSHSDDQIKLFSSHAKSLGGHFILVVPDNAKQKAEKTISSLGIEATIWTVDV